MISETVYVVFSGFGELHAAWRWLSSRNGASSLHVVELQTPQEGKEARPARVEVGDERLVNRHRRRKK